jgi:hypothetical protein
MRLTLIIASVIVGALVAYARLLAVAHDASRAGQLDSGIPSPMTQTDLAASQTN